MAVENGYGGELDMSVVEENHDNSSESDKEDGGVKKELKITSTENEPTTTVLMEVDEVQDSDPLVVDSSSDKIIIASCNKINNIEKNDKNDVNGDSVSETIKDGKNITQQPEFVIVESTELSSVSGKPTTENSVNLNSNSADSLLSSSNVKVKEEPNEIVIIDSEDEKEEKPKVKSVPPSNIRTRQNTLVGSKPTTNPAVSKPTTNAGGRQYNSNSRNKSDFHVVSVDDDSSMNKTDPMNVFLCSTDEREFRKDYFKDSSSNVLKQRLHCTICDIHIGACPQNSKNMVCHRFLKVLICRKCANFYGQGEFPQDDGSDEFCRWCGEGGEVFLCNSCPNVFCQACILRNFGMQEVKRVDKLENWDCYVCDSRPLWTLRAIAFALFTYVRRIKVVAYRNGMYQSINSNNAKISKADLMALETDLSTCCPKEVKAAAAAASVVQPEPQKPSNQGKLKEIKTPTQTKTPQSKTPLQNKVVDKPSPSNLNKNYNQRNSSGTVPRTSKRKPAPKQMPWQPTQTQSQIVPDYFNPGPGQHVPSISPVFPRTPQSVIYPQQSTLRNVLSQQASFISSPPPLISTSFIPQNNIFPFVSNVISGKEGERNVVSWFNGILLSLMDTMKNIDNRFVFIRNSMSNLISQNEVSFLVNQLHNLLKVSCSKLQEVDCDLLKNYKEFIDKSEINVSDFDDIVKEFPEFFKPNENAIEPPENSDTDSGPEPPDDFNPLALVEVIEDGDQSSQVQSNDTSKQSSEVVSEKTVISNSSELNSSQSSSSSKSVSSLATPIKNEMNCEDYQNADEKSDLVDVGVKRKASDDISLKNKISLLGDKIPIVVVKKELFDDHTRAVICKKSNYDSSDFQAFVSDNGKKLNEFTGNNKTKDSEKSSITTRSKKLSRQRSQRYRAKRKK